MSDDTPATQTLQVYPAAQFRATEGAAEGDAITFADDLVLDDIYQLAEGAERLTMVVMPTDAPTHFVVHDGTQRGTIGNDLYLDCCVTLIVPDSTTIEALIFVEVEDGEVADTYVLPLATPVPNTDYRLVGVDRHAATSRLSEAACVSFTRGTHITLASGQQRVVEDLIVGDRVLTRDDGPQKVRWIGQTTLRAVGAFAPVVIKKCTLFNDHDLVLSPDHRIFVYQRKDTLGAGRAEVLIKVRHLINNDTVFQRDGGFVDYFQLLFDEHQIVYAEGIAAESLLIDTRTRGALPDDISANRHRERQHSLYEVTESLLSAPDVVALLRRASSS